MTPEKFYKQHNIKLKPAYPGLECPNCSKFMVNNSLICDNCQEEYSEDDICLECEKLVKGSCYYCKMD